MGMDDPEEKRPRWEKEDAAWEQHMAEIWERIDRGQEAFLRKHEAWKLEVERIMENGIGCSKAV